MPGLLLDTLNGSRSERTPLWLMRQAGRYLPEYRALRAEKGGFLAMAYDSEAACEVTLQPIERFGFDGAILFSDILIVPHALGQHLEFLAGEGPKLSPRLVDASLDALTRDPSRYEPIYQTVRLCRERLGEDVTMLGFAGSPWTVATYMVAGEGSRDQHEARAMAYRDPGALQAIIDAIVIRRSRICAARSMRARRLCNCSTAGQGVSLPTNSSAGSSRPMRGSWRP